MTKTINQYNALKFFILTYLISWGLWSPFYFSQEANELWVLPGAWGPTISAIILTYSNSGKAGIRKLLRKFLIWKVSIRYYLFSIFTLLFIGLISILIYKTFAGKFPDLNMILEGAGLSKGEWSVALVLFPVFFLSNILLGGPIAEELGWRGYAQEKLQQKLNPNITGLIIGFLWSLWHLPLFIYLPKAIGQMPIWAYIPLMTAMGLIFSWLYNRTKGSVLLAVLMHGGMNFTFGFLGMDLLNDKLLLSIMVGLIIILSIVLSLNNKKVEPHLGN